MTIRNAFTAGVVIFLMALLWHRIDFLHDRVYQMETLDEESGNKASLIVEDQKLFGELLKKEVIVPYPDGIRLKLPDKDQDLVYRAFLQQHPDISDKERRVIQEKIQQLKGLFHTPAGVEVINQVELWNRAHLLAAVRDNRTQSFGIRHNFWEVSDQDYPRQALETGLYVPESYGFIHQGQLKPGFSNWLSASAPPRNPLVFNTVFQLEESTQINIQGIGELVYETAGTVPSFFGREGHPVERNKSVAFDLVYTFPPGRHAVRLGVKPVLDKQPRISGLKICQENTKNHFVWKDPGASTPAFHKSYKVTSSDGIELVTTSGFPTPFSEKTGLVPLLGFSRQDTYALSGILAKSRIPASTKDIRLTIDSRWQAKAQQILQEKLEEFFPDGKDEYVQDRRGAVVLINANTGAILAAAGIPTPPANTHPWDMISFAKTYPLKNPMVVRAWKGLDKNNAPGSSFKPVVALAGLEAMDDNKLLEKFIQGYAKNELLKQNNSSGLYYDSAIYQPLTGMSYSPNRMPGNLKSKIANFNREPLFKSIETKTESGCPEDPTLTKSVMGLDQAVRDSVNIWFSRLAVIMDGESARQYDELMKNRKFEEARPDFPAFQLAKMAEYLGFGDAPIDLAANLPREFDLNRSPYKQNLWQGDVLYATPGRLNLMNRNEGGFLWILAQNAIGQGVETSPLQIARVAASIASGRVVSPFLFREVNRDELEPPHSKGNLLNSKKLTRLRQAMKRVPTEGTAHSAFLNHPDRCRIYGKTGTANVAVTEGKTVRTQKTFFTTWFMGWRDPADDKEPPIAFACMVTHGHGQYYTGGRVCAPIMAKILEKD